MRHVDQYRIGMYSHRPIEIKQNIKNARANHLLMQLAWSWRDSRVPRAFARNLVSVQHLSRIDQKLLGIWTERRDGTFSGTPAAATVLRQPWLEMTDSHRFTSKQERNVLCQTAAVGPKNLSQAFEC